MTRTLLPCLVLLLLMALPLATAATAPGPGEGDGTRGSWTVRRFDESTVPVGVRFETSRENSTYHVTVPNTATITSASMTLEGVQRYSLKGTLYDFSGKPPALHEAYQGENGAYPPVQSPSNYNERLLDDQEEDALEYLDNTTHQTRSPQGINPPPSHWSYQLFDMRVNATGMVRLQVEWHGWGHCPGNDTVTHGAEVYVWNFTSTKWIKLGSYHVNDTFNQVRTMSRTFEHPAGLVDAHGHCCVLAFGMHDEPGPMGWPDQGIVATDYLAVTVLKNDTLQWPRDVGISIDGDPAFWSHSGELTSSVTLGDAEGLKAALQDHVDSFPPSPQPVVMPFVFRVRAATFGAVRVTSLSVGVQEVNNQPPEFLFARQVNMSEDEDVFKAIDLWDHFDDDYNGHDLLYTVAYEENASAIRAEVHADGHSVNLLTAARDWQGEVTFRFNATDVWGLTTTSDAFLVVVSGVNDAPALEDPGDFYIDEDEPFELNLTAFDPDIPYGDILTFTDDSDLVPLDPATGRIAFTPRQEDVGNYNVTVTVRDSSGLTASVTFLISISDINDPPVIDDPGELVAYEGRRFSHNFTASDDDQGESFTWQLVGGVGTMFMGFQNGRLSWIPEGEHVGLVNVSVIVTDRRGASHQLEVSIRVMNVNDPPVLDPLPYVKLTEGQRYVHTLGFEDPDLEVDPGEAHVFTVEPRLFDVSATGLVDFTPTNDDVGDHLLTVTVTDAGGLSHSLVWDLKVENVNQAPVIEPVEDPVWHEDEPVLLTLVASDPDVGDRLTFSDSTSMFDVGARSGVINFTPTQNNVGRHSVSVRVTDEAGLEDVVYFEVTVLARNDPPVVNIRVHTIKERLTEGDSLSLAADVSDEDNERGELLFTWLLDGKEKGNTDSIVLKGLSAGEHEVELRVNDGGSTVSAFHTFEVEDVVEPFPWSTLITLLVVVIIVLVLVLKVALPWFRGDLLPEKGPEEQGKGRGTKGKPEARPEEVDDGLQWGGWKE